MQASAASWLAETGLPVDKDGFLLVNDCLQSDGGPPDVFAAGDVASNSRNPRPKAGVFAVRAVSGWRQRGGGQRTNCKEFVQTVCLAGVYAQPGWHWLIAKVMHVPTAGPSTGGEPAAPADRPVPPAMDASAHLPVADFCRRQVCCGYQRLAG